MNRQLYLQHRPSTKTASPTDDRMRRACRWTVWTLKHVEGKDKPNKVPESNPTDHQTWLYYYAARARLSNQKLAGVGFEMYGQSGIIGIDIDNCVDPKFGERTPLLKDFLTILEKHKTRCHVELSPSGKGVRCFAAETIVPFHDFTNKETGVEVYTGESGRFLAFTGQMLPEFSEIEGPFDPLPAEAVEFLAAHASKWKDGRETEAKVAQAPLPELSQRKDWKDLHPNALKKIGKAHSDFIETGAVGAKYASASEALFAAEQQLLKYLKPAEVYQILISGDGSWHTAMEHRENSSEKAKAFLWDDINRCNQMKLEREKAQQAEASTWRDCGIDTELTEDGARAKLTQLNMIRAFEKHEDWRELAYDEFRGEPTVNRAPLTPRQYAEASAWTIDFMKWQFEPRREILTEALVEGSKARKYNPIEEFLRGFVWDGKNRLKKFVEALCEAPEQLDEEILRKWWIGYVARGLKPGCQMDTMLCLRGEEGAKKTSLARLLAGRPEWFTDTAHLGLDTDSAMLRVGRRIIEIGEGVATRKGDRNELKMDLSRACDDFRPKYGRSVVRVPRQFVYILTTNPKVFLRSDQDGLRRIWPIDVKPLIDLEWISENLGQLIAQACVWFDKGERWWFDKEKDAPELLEALRERAMGAVAEDPLDSLLEKIAANEDNAKKGWMGLDEIYLQIEALRGTTLQQFERAHIPDLMQKNGFIQKRTRMDGHQYRRWIHKSWAQEKEGEVIPLQQKAAPE
jgi:hypothetical protein